MTNSHNGFGPHIIISGMQQFHNELLHNFIQSKLNLKCSSHTTSELTGVSHLDGKKRLVLFDCQKLSSHEIWATIKKTVPLGKSNCSVALFNSRPDKNFEVEALTKGVKGVFYKNDSLDSFKKGLQVIIEGELWFSREIMSKTLQENHRNSSQDNPSAASILTDREKEILTLVASGQNNSEISSQLHISYHTVKTHINNIYKKINAPSRVQAVLWAAKNL